MKIQLLNHASITLELQDMKLLCDPWFSGGCFDDGWGLMYHNSEALHLAKQCSHLWISHFHDDHFHLPTLRELAIANPDIIVLGNHSYNFQLDNAVKRLGFKNVVPLFERKPLQLTTRIAVTRFPTTGIDNMLLVESDEGRILNYNDCNVPLRTRQILAKKIGKIDVLLNNFNQSAKILDYPLPPSEKTKKELIENFQATNDSFNPAWIIPFASYHYFKAEASQAQNESLMDVSELQQTDPRIIPLRVGDVVEFGAASVPHVTESLVRIVKNELEIKEPGTAYSFDELVTASKEYARKVNKAFLNMLWLPSLRIRIEDIDVNATFNIRRGLSRLTPTASREADWHVSAHSSSLHRWFNKPYGTDTFYVGAHFEIAKQGVKPFRWLLLFALMTENKVDLRSVLKMLLSKEGGKFLYNRREEILPSIWQIFRGSRFDLENP